VKISNRNLFCLFIYSEKPSSKTHKEFPGSSQNKSGLSGRNFRRSAALVYPLNKCHYDMSGLVARKNELHPMPPSQIKNGKKKSEG
jgi:hypothetical protein